MPDPQQLIREWRERSELANSYGFAEDADDWNEAADALNSVIELLNFVTYAFFEDKTLLREATTRVIDTFGILE